MDFLLLARVVLKLNREPSITFPSIAARRERAGQKRRGADEPRVARCDAHGVRFRQRRRRVRDVDVQRQCARLERSRGDVCLCDRTRGSVSRLRPSSADVDVYLGSSLAPSAPFADCLRCILGHLGILSRTRRGA